jgi:hypothetical protein
MLEAATSDALFALTVTASAPDPHQHAPWQSHHTTPEENVEEK